MRAAKKGNVLNRSFYCRNTLTVAKQLLGKLLVRELPEGKVAGKIVEVEAYRGSDDPASHAYKGKTQRNQIMFGEGGYAYIYFIYGKHFCLNVTTEKIGVPGAVLIRAVEPVYGIEIMKRKRRTENVKSLTNGPGKLTQAMDITVELNGWDLTRGERLYICDLDVVEPFEVVSSGRIGVKAGADKPWRFFIKGNLFVSKRISS